MGRRMLGWWETRSRRGRVLLGIPIAFGVLLAFHKTFFPLLDWSESTLYAVMECVPLALLMSWATENELRRRSEDMDDQN